MSDFNALLPENYRQWNLRVGARPGWQPTFYLRGPDGKQEGWFWNHVIMEVDGARELQATGSGVRVALIDVGGAGLSFRYKSATIETSWFRADDFGTIGAPIGSTGQTVRGQLGIPTSGSIIASFQDGPDVTFDFADAASDPDPKTWIENIVAAFQADIAATDPGAADVAYINNRFAGVDTLKLIIFSTTFGEESKVTLKATSTQAVCDTCQLGDRNAAGDVLPTDYIGLTPVCQGQPADYNPTGSPFRAKYMDYTIHEALSEGMYDLGLSGKYWPAGSGEERYGGRQQAISQHFNARTADAQAYRDNGSTSVPATREFTIPAGDDRAQMVGARVGDVLHIEGSADAGNYNIVGIDYEEPQRHNYITKFTVDRDWPTGSLAGLSYYLLLKDHPNRVHYDFVGHAVQMAGHMAGQGKSNYPSDPVKGGYEGIAPEATYIPFRVGGLLSTHLKAMEAAVKAKCDVMGIWFSQTNLSSVEFMDWDFVVSTLADYGCLVCLSPNNGSTDLDLDGSANHSDAQAAIVARGMRVTGWGWNNQTVASERADLGATLRDNFGSCVDCCAPEGAGRSPRNLVTLYQTASWGMPLQFAVARGFLDPGGIPFIVGTINGSSVATAHLVGQAALVTQTLGVINYKKALSEEAKIGQLRSKVELVRAIILATCDFLSGQDVKYQGAGRINSRRAVEKANMVRELGLLT